jgi:hypothetical protein
MLDAFQHIPYDQVYRSTIFSHKMLIYQSEAAKNDELRSSTTSASFLI